MVSSPSKQLFILAQQTLLWDLSRFELGLRKPGTLGKRFIKMQQSIRELYEKIVLEIFLYISPPLDARRLTSKKMVSMLTNVVFLWSFFTASLRLEIKTELLITLICFNETFRYSTLLCCNLLKLYFVYIFNSDSYKYILY